MINLYHLSYNTHQLSSPSSFLTTLILYFSNNQIQRSSYNAPSPHLHPLFPPLTASIRSSKPFKLKRHNPNHRNSPSPTAR